MKYKILTLAAAASVLLSACGSNSGSLKGASGSSLPTIDVAANPLTEVTSATATNPFTAKAAPGQLLLVYLGYTNCPDICPTTMSDIRTARQALPAADQSKVTGAFVSVDQTNDTPTVLLDYIHRFGWTSADHAIRPTNAELTATEKTLFATSQNGDKATSGVQIVNHTAYVYVVNSQGHVVDEWDYGFLPKDMTHDMSILLKSA